MPKTSRFYDGKTAQRYDLTLSISAGRLIGTQSTGAISLHWDIGSIRVITEPEGDREAIITATTDDQARLYIERSLFLQLVPMLSRKARRRCKVNITAGSIFFWSVVAIAVTLAVFYSFTKLTPLIARNMPAAWEESLGKRQLHILTMNSKICHTRPGLVALRKISLALSRGGDELRISVIENDIINAYALPGNRIVIYSGLIKKAEHPAELAGVLAHEMAHIIKGHPLQAMVHNAGLSWIVKLLFGGGGIGTTGQALFELSYSRDVEREADQIGLQILMENNIDPNGFRTFLQREMQRQEPLSNSKIWSYLSTHPTASERVSAITEGDIRQGYRTLLSEREWQALLNICNDRYR